MAGDNLKKRFDIIQKQIHLKLDEIRETHQHKSSKGENVEEIIREFLSIYFPSDHRVGYGEVIDTKGSISTQLDVIMTNQYHPYINDLTKPSLFFIEGIACSGEVKSILTSHDLEMILKNCLQYKKLEIYIAKGTMIHSNPSDRARFIEKRPYFLFAFESQITIETILKKIVEFNKKERLDIRQQIDAIFLLDRGSIINFGDGKGNLKFQNSKGKFISGYVGRKKELDPNILFGFITWISAVIPRFTMFSNILIPYLVQAQKK